MSLKSLLLSLAIVAAGCDPPKPPTTFHEINSQILQRSCANFSTCHSVQGAKDAAKLDLFTDPYKALVNVVSTEPDTKAAGLMLVKPSFPDESLLYLKLNLPLSATDDGGYEESMPLGNPHLPDYDISGIRTWILMGAPNN
ncbi:MAG TPA: hypothetical protein VFF06_11010 [Polyangia bacterium]|nr:hypothetical protein [Polyangia bacterium]